MMHQQRGFLDRYRAPLLILVMLLCGAVAQAQYLQPIPNYGYRWNRGQFTTLFAPPAERFAVPLSLQDIPWYAVENKVPYVWNTMTKDWESIGASVDSFTYATRARLYNALDSLVATIPTPNLQAVTDAGNTTTHTIYAGGFVTGAYKALLYEGGGAGWLDLKDEADNVTVKARGAGAGGRGEVTTEALEFQTNLPAPPNEYNAGSWYVYMRADTLRAFKDGVEYSLVSDAGSGSSSPTLSTLTYGTTTTWDYATKGPNAQLTLTGNSTLGFINLPTGVAYLTLEVIQDATGGRTLSIPASVQILGGNSSYSLSTTGGAVDILTFYWNGSTLYMNYGKDYKY